MKKWMSMLLLVATLVSMLAASAAAEAEPVTLAELREQAPERLQMTVTTDAGNTIEVDAPVIVPEGEDLPVLVCKNQLFDMSKVDEIYPLEKGSSTYEYFGNPDASDHDKFIYCAQESKSYLLRGRTDVTERYALPMGSTPPLNDFTLDDAIEFILENNRIFGGDPNVDLRVGQAVAMSGICKTMSGKVTDESTGVSFGGVMANPKKPVEGRERGLWEIEAAQYLRGARVLGGRSRRYVSLGNQGVWPIEPTRNRSLMMDRENFWIMLQYLREERELAQNVALADWAAVENAIRELIEQDKLKSVYQVELVYQVMVTKADCDTLSEGKIPWQELREWEKQIEYVLVPGWEIKGYALNDRNAKYFAKSESPDEAAILYNGLDNKWLQDDYTLLLSGEDARPLTGQDLIFDLEEGKR